MAKEHIKLNASQTVIALVYLVGYWLRDNKWLMLAGGVTSVFSYYVGHR